MLVKIDKHNFKKVNTMENERKLKLINKDIGLSRIDLPLSATNDVLNLMRSIEVDCNMLKERIDSNSKNGEAAILNRLSDTVDRLADYLFG